MAYVTTEKSTGLCGCNGETWVPLMSDPASHAACSTLKENNCKGKRDNSKKITSELAFPRWNPESNDGNGAWEAITWTYGGIPALSGDARECGYVCNLGFHPGVNNPEGWQMGGCKACSNIANKYAWRSA